MRPFRVVPALPALVALTACASASAPAPLAAQDGVREADPRVITVDANAVVQRTPDRAILQLAVETPAATAREAAARNAEIMDRVIAAVRRLDIPQSNIQTGRISLQPRYETRRDPRAPVRDPREPGREPEIVGYIALNSVTVTVDSIPRVGAVIDAGIEAGANRVAGLHFTLRDPETAHAEALRLAVERARRQAAVVAEALGESLGPALRVNTSGFQPQYRVGPAMMEAARDLAAPAPPPTPVEPGEVDVQAHVSITFRIGS